jgi:hypothetical protein
MALLDSIVSANFRSENAGRVVVFPGDRRHRGYLVRSQAEELKIRSFLKMFYYAHASILLLGGLLASGWSTDLRHVLDRQAEHVLRAEGIFLGIYLFVVGVPYFLVWRSYKKAFLSFVSAEDEVSVSGRSAGRRQILVVAGLIVLGAIAMGISLLFLVSRKP